MQAVRHFRQLRTRLRPVGRSYSSDVWPKTTMNDIPTPKGSWQTQYDTNQKKYNRDLILGTVFLAGTLAFGQYSGMHEFYSDIPSEPGKVDSYRVE